MLPYQVKNFLVGLANCRTTNSCIENNSNLLAFFSACDVLAEKAGLTNVVNPIELSLKTYKKIGGLTMLQLVWKRWILR